MTLSGKIRLMIILNIKSRTKQGFTLSLKDTFLEKPWGGGGERVSVTPSSPPAF